MDGFSLAFALVLSALAPKEELRFRGAAEQGFDTSCGLSAAACLMSEYWGLPASEGELAAALPRSRLLAGDLRVSLADLKAALEARGFAARAYRMDFEELAAAAARHAPVLVHYDRPEGHFALVLGVAGGRVVAADPATGTAALGRADFLRRYGGLALLAARRDLARDEGALKAALALAGGRAELLERVTR